MSTHAPRLRIGLVPGIGRGVFAASDFHAGEVIERAPVIVIPAAECSDLDRTTLFNYYYGWGPEDADGAVVLGYGSLYNHAYSPNATFRHDPASANCDFIALRDIAAGEEITINYNQDPDDRSALWFPTVDR